MRPRLVAAAAALLPSIVPAGELLPLRNPGFDEPSQSAAVPGWGKLPPNCRVIAGEGMNGTSALVFEADEPTPLVLPAQPVRLKAGHRYRYSAMMKYRDVRVKAHGDEPYVGEGFGFAFEYFDKDGKWCGGHYDDNRKRGKGEKWVKVEGFSRPVPAKAVTMRFGPMVRPKNTGKLWVDDVELEDDVGAPVEALYSSAYRGTVADGETVRLAAALNLVTNDLSLAAVEARFLLCGADGSGASFEPEEFRADCAKLTLPAEKLPIGTNEVVFAARTNGVLLGSAVTRLVRIGRRPTRKVDFDREGRAIVDGKPFFPLGLYVGGLTDLFGGGRLGTVASSPFNCVLPYQPLSVKQLDALHEKGLKVIYSVKDGFAGRRYSAVANANDEEAWVARTVRARKEHPAIIAWYINDECPPGMSAQLTRRRDFLERLDPGRPTFSVLYQHLDVRKYLASLDVVGTDPYPVPDSRLSTAAAWTRDTVSGTLGLRPVWQVPQIFDWGAYVPGRSKRPPTLAEMRSMAWQCIACGANGLVFYAFMDICRTVNGVPFERRWADVCAMGGEIARFAPVMLAAGRGPAFRAPSADVAVRTWSQGCGTYVLAVDLSGKTRVVTLSSECPHETADAVFGPAARLTDQKTLALELGAYEPALYRLAGARARGTRAPTRCEPNGGRTCERE